jgi:hypothetical protein
LRLCVRLKNVVHLPENRCKLGFTSFNPTYGKMVKVKVLSSVKSLTFMAMLVKFPEVNSLQINFPARGWKQLFTKT